MKSACQRREKKIASWLLLLIRQPQADGVCKINAIQERKSKEYLFPACQSRASFQSAGWREQRTAGLCSKAWTSAQSFPYLLLLRASSQRGGSFENVEKLKINSTWSFWHSALNAFLVVNWTPEPWLTSLRGAREILASSWAPVMPGCPSELQPPPCHPPRCSADLPKTGSGNYQGGKKPKT